VGVALMAAGVVDPLGFRRPASSMWYRSGYWLGVWEVFRRHWPLGVGLDGFADHYVRFKTSIHGEAQRAHNDYLQILVEGGVIVAGLESPASSARPQPFWRAERVTTT